MRILNIDGKSEYLYKESIKCQYIIPFLLNSFPLYYIIILKFLIYLLSMLILQSCTLINVKIFLQIEFLVTFK